MALCYISFAYMPGLAVPLYIPEARPIMSESTLTGIAGDNKKDTMGDNRVLVNSCCCGCSLRTGSLIIAALSLIYGLLGIAYSIYIVVGGVVEGWLDLALALLNVIFAIILIVGVRQCRPRLVMAWVWAAVLSVILGVVLGVLYVILTESFVIAVIICAISAIQAYFIVVVHSFARTLDETHQTA
ncbi:uncharacterized protein LOC122252249 [Penaeus japonicus]|uniref:uncharacterized protein LOC122252249 n=1 Tax=Penaeus japonicus TaxID=27405 RepID=UPI001C716F46|nr:uncharacterized protein LOC122252249 [Penaeus japonicus]